MPLKKRFLSVLVCLLSSLIINKTANAQYADLGTGTLKNTIWWFDWNGFTPANGASKTFNTDDGLKVTITFSNVSGPALQPSVMNTYSGSLLYRLYDFSNTNIKPALYYIKFPTPYTIKFTMNITATRNGVPTAFNFVAGDAEESLVNQEFNTLTTTGSVWNAIDFYTNNAQPVSPLTGCNTTTATLTHTYDGVDGFGQNALIQTVAPNTGNLTINATLDEQAPGGGMGLAFGIFAAIDRGDLPASYGTAQHSLTYQVNNPCSFSAPFPSLTQSQSLKLGALPGDADPVQYTNDNAHGTADEDAISTFPAYNSNGTYSLNIPVTNTTGANAYLTGWFDENRDGIFNPGESVTVTVPNNSTSATLTWAGLPNVLTKTSVDSFGFRFRLSSNLAATQSVSGYAPDGEVEDYLVPLQITLACTGNCPLTNNININTGYNPATNSNLATGQRDVNWTVVGMSSQMQNALCYGSYLNSQGPLPNIPAVPPVFINQNGYVVLPGEISCFPYITLYTVPPPANPPGGAFDYTMNIRRPFYVCSNQPESVTLNFTATCDDAVDSIIVDKGTPGQTILLSSMTKTVGAGSPYTVNQTLVLQPGLHTLDIQCADWQDLVGGDYYPITIAGNTKQYQWNPFGVKIVGNITSANNVLVAPTCCTTSNTTFDTSICQGQSDYNHIVSGTYVDTFKNVMDCDSIRTLHLTVLSTPFVDFTYNEDVCNPYNAIFSGTIAAAYTSYKWDFGFNQSNTSSLTPTATYPGYGLFPVKFSAKNAIGCTDTVMKNVYLNVKTADVIITNDTTLCNSNGLQLLTRPGTSFCWSPTTFLNNPLSANPITTAQQQITYQFTTQTPGKNVITNGDFESGNTGFITDNTYCNSNNCLFNLPYQGYSVGSNANFPHASFSGTGHGGAGNFLIVNGGLKSLRVWEQTVTVQPNTFYNFTMWLATMFPQNPAPIEAYINDSSLGHMYAPSTTNTWIAYRGYWYSGNNTTAKVTILCTNTSPDIYLHGGDFGIDDISLVPVQTQQENITITPGNISVKASNDTLICKGNNIQLNASGATTYTWNPATGLSDPNIANPVATANASTRYIVTGKDVSGCIGKDTVNISIYPKPVITRSNDTSICNNSSARLFATGGTSYQWTPISSVNNPASANPIVSPSSNTTYYVNITDANSCSYTDSVRVNIKPLPVFAVCPDQNICTTAPAQLNASGGDTYLWSPASSVSNAAISNPLTTATATTTYTVSITESLCHNSATLSTVVSILPPLTLSVTKSNDLDCSNGSAKLTVSGADFYSWSPTTGLTDPGSATPVASPLSTQQYIVKGESNDGCIGYDSITVYTNFTGKSGYYMPNAFSPNGDGLNDCFGIKYWGIIEKLEFIIYDRFGNKVFSTNDPNACWDGNYKGQPADPDNYVYYIKAITACGAFERKGNVVLIR